MSEQEPPANVIAQSVKFMGLTTLIAILIIVCGYYCAVVVITGCLPEDAYYRGRLQAKPAIVLPDNTTKKYADGGQGNAGGWTGGLYVTTLSPENVVDFYRQLGVFCEVSANTVYKLGGFELDIQAPYWNCRNVPAQPWSHGTVMVFPQAGYINALKTIYDNPPDLYGGRTINETDVGYQLHEFYEQTPFPDTDWPEGGSLLETFVSWCDPF
jgi:hypothetical protein